MVVFEAALSVWLEELRRGRNKEEERETED